MAANRSARGSLASAPEFERLLRGETLDSAQRHARLCGQWLTLQRIRCDVDVERAARVLGVDANTMMYLELGLLKTGQLAGEQIVALARLLAEDAHDTQFVANVIAIAGRLCDDNQEEVIHRVVEDLRPDR